MKNRKRMISILIKKVHTRYPGYETFALVQLAIMLLLVFCAIAAVESFIATVIANLIVYKCFMVTFKQFIVLFLGILIYYLLVKPVSDEAIEQYEKEILDA